MAFLASIFHWKEMSLSFVRAARKLSRLLFDGENFNFEIAICITPWCTLYDDNHFNEFES